MSDAVLYRFIVLKFLRVRRQRLSPAVVVVDFGTSGNVVFNVVGLFTMGW